jgi:glycosyl transferase family 25
MFNKIFYINLDRRIDRNNFMKDLLNSYNLQYERISAVDGRKLDLDKLPPNIITKEGIDDAKNNNNRVYVPLTRGGIGCTLSHYNTWKRIATDKSINGALILEDDIDFSLNFTEDINNIMKNHPKDFDIIFIGYHPSTFKYIQRNKIYNKLYFKSLKVYGLFGYIVSKKGAEKLLNIFPITNQIDSEIPKHFNKINAYVIKPENRIITSEPSEVAYKFGTDIQVREHDINEPWYIIYCTFGILFILIIVICILQYKKNI